MDVNLTKSIDTINALDNDISSPIQTFLQPLYEHYPIFAKTIFDIPLANLLAASMVFILVLGFRHFFANTIMGILQQLVKKTETYYDDRIISALKEPIKFAIILFAIHLFFILIFKETDFIKQILNSMVVYTVFWAILSITEALRELIYSATAKVNKDLTKEMGNFILTLIKIFISAIGLAAMLTVWGINVTALIASLGLGGLAFALAAKDTVSNLFGSFALLADKSIRIGEWVKVGGVEGVVEDVGMRTTKIRSFEKTLITVPNQIIANSHIENFSRRGVRRIKMHIGLTYSTSSSQLNKIIQDIRELLLKYPSISNDESQLVNFDNFGASSLDIFIYTFTTTANWNHYLDIKQEIQLNIMKIVENNGSSFAFPSQSIYVEQLPTPNEEKD